MRNHLKPQAYLRYGDDFILFAKNRHQTRQYQVQATDFLKNNLNLSINPKNNIIVKASDGLHFLGHIITSSNLVVDKHTTKAVLSKINARNIASYKSLKLDQPSKNQLDYLMLDDVDKIYIDF